MKNSGEDILTTGLGPRPQNFGGPVDFFFAWQLNSTRSASNPSLRDAAEGYLVLTRFGLWVDAFSHSSHAEQAVSVRWEDMTSIKRIPAYRRLLTHLPGVLPLIEVGTVYGPVFFRIGWLDSFVAKRAIETTREKVLVQRQRNQRAVRNYTPPHQNR